VLVPSYTVETSTSETLCVHFITYVVLRQCLNATHYYTIIQHFRNFMYVCPLWMFIAIVPNTGLSTTIPSTTQIYSNEKLILLFVMQVLMVQIGVGTTAPSTTQIHSHAAFWTLHASTVNIDWYQYTTTPYPVLHKYTHRTSETSRVHVLSDVCGAPPHPTHATQMLHFRIFMCVHCECAWCKNHRPVLYEYVHSNSETSFVLFMMQVAL
jgi:hypothetical protein